MVLGPKNFKLGLKHWIGTAIVGIIAGLVIFGMIRGEDFLADLLVGQEEEAIQDEFGGQTPENTFDLFLDALKKGDTELASKYFVVDRQEDWQRVFEELERNDIFDEIVLELEFARNTGQKITEGNIVRFMYRDGAEIIFENIFGKWKIVEI